MSPKEASYGSSKQFREAAARENLGRHKNGWRYSPDLRALGAEYCRSQRRAGRPFREIAEDLGVSTLTLSRWHEESLSAGFRPVEVIADPEVCDPIEEMSLSVVTPGGLRIEGLSWPQVMELAKAYR